MTKIADERLTHPNTHAPAEPDQLWAITEYHNADGWPTRGFSQSSGIHDVWNIWIIYPAIAWAFLTTAFGLDVYLRKPVTGSQIKREMERQPRPKR